MSIFHSSDSGTSMRNAIDLPSGDQRKLTGVSCTRVTCDVAPSASIQRTKTWLSPASSSAV